MNLNRTLAAVDLLAAVEVALAADAGGLDRLRVDDDGTGLRVPAGGQARQ
jgi:hypothetical protein